MKQSSGPNQVYENSTIITKLFASSSLTEITLSGMSKLRRICWRCTSRSLRAEPQQSSRGTLSRAYREGEGRRPSENIAAWQARFPHSPESSSTFLQPLQITGTGRNIPIPAVNYRGPNPGTSLQDRSSLTFFLLRDSRKNKRQIYHKPTGLWTPTTCEIVYLKSGSLKVHSTSLRCLFDTRICHGSTHRHRRGVQLDLKGNIINKGNTPTVATVDSVCPKGSHLTLFVVNDRLVELRRQG